MPSRKIIMRFGTTVEAKLLYPNGIVLISEAQFTTFAPQVGGALVRGLILQPLGNSIARPLASSLHTIVIPNDTNCSPRTMPLTMSNYSIISHQ
jgi:hypothetical protein